MKLLISIASLMMASFLNAAVCPSKITEADLLQLSSGQPMSFENRNFKLRPYDRVIVKSFIENSPGNVIFAVIDAQDEHAANIRERKRCSYKGVYIAADLDPDQMSFNAIKAKQLSKHELEFTLINFENNQ